MNTDLSVGGTWQCQAANWFLRLNHDFAFTSGARGAGGRGAAAVAAAAHTWLTLTKRFTNLKVNLKCLGLYTGAKMQRVSYEFE